MSFQNTYSDLILIIFICIILYKYKIDVSQTFKIKKKQQIPSFLVNNYDAEHISVNFNLLMFTI